MTQQPTFLIIGAMKAGTTLLWDALNQHPEIFMSQIKEPHYFASAASHPCQPVLEGGVVHTTDYDEYLALFARAQNVKAIGEASTSSLHVPGTAAQIHQTLPHAKILCVLRQPVERAYSHYLYLARLGIEAEKDFAAALALEENRKVQRVAYGQYRSKGLYYRQLQQFFSCFPKDQIFICTLEDLTQNSIETYQHIFEFLDVEPTFRPDTRVRRNPSGVPKSHWLEVLLSRPSTIKRIIQPRLPRWLYLWITQLRDSNLTKPPLASTLRAELTEYYRPDILSLQEVLERDLNHWLQSADEIDR